MFSISSGGQNHGLESLLSEAELSQLLNGVKQQQNSANQPSEVPQPLKTMEIITSMDGSISDNFPIHVNGTQSQGRITPLSIKSCSPIHKPTQKVEKHRSGSLPAGIKSYQPNGHRPNGTGVHRVSVIPIADCETSRLKSASSIQSNGKTSNHVKAHVTVIDENISKHP